MTKEELYTLLKTVGKEVDEKLEESGPLNDFKFNEPISLEIKYFNDDGSFAINIGVNYITTDDVFIPHEDTILFEASTKFKISHLSDAILDAIIEYIWTN